MLIIGRGVYVARKVNKYMTLSEKFTTTPLQVVTIGFPITVVTGQFLSRQLRGCEPKAWSPKHAMIEADTDQYVSDIRNTQWKTS